MNKLSLKRSLLGLTFAYVCAAPAILLAQPQTVEQKAAYTIGSNFIQSLKAQGIQLDLNSVIQGIQDGSKGQSVLSEDEMKAALNAFKEKLIKEQEMASGNNKEEGDAFLEKNKSKEGVVTLKSGLQYKVITSGTGATPKATDKVTTHYRGRLINGTEFDSSYSRNEPTSFPVNGVIPGWTEALQLMKVGDKWELYIPSNLAYGNRAVGNHITPNSTLIFEIELLKVN
ncbi:MAG: FKBP-type peptidyl-prolyl cis-trans isomerase [Gammaproteobacteria bacterium]|nr:FKBP-type peptidyl-prolyl cis-trans isomerase [Gammaproteobacteria bacterium]